jgi:hypothetical protein
VDKNSIGK